ncbi:hypothetical protein QZH41_015009 [Actinostola sp. cb2023]|nr:hypothetical protein QZH41_015009 [Actinostola sp. cb2023]
MGPRRAICMQILVVAVFYGSTAKLIQRGTKVPCTKHGHKHRKHAQMIAAATPFPQLFSARVTTKPPHKHSKTKTPCTRRHPQHLKSTPRPTQSRPPTRQPKTTATTITAACKPLECVLGEWSDWTPCSSSCGNTGVKQRHRKIITESSCGGVCHHPLQENKPCHRFCMNGGSLLQRGCKCLAGYDGVCCEKVGNGGSGAVGGIGKRHGHATSSRHDKRHTINIRHDRRRLLSHVSSDIIENFDAIVQSYSEELLQRDDRTNVVGPWTSWSSCSTTCGTGQRFRSRACNDLANPCIGVPMDVQPCNTGDCTP